MLEGEPCEIGSVGFAGIKGFCGGFGRHMLAPWGEEIVKLFVRETIDEALQLESELGKLRTEFRIAVLHYAPVRDTVEGEPPEIFPFLGASRLAEPVDRFEVTAVFHGHAHHGSPEGRTTGGVPVYNVSLPLMRRVNPERPYYLLEL
jgi:Icc-related predicted phosphoesterase